jgi:hypothetical protein
VNGKRGGNGSRERILVFKHHTKERNPDRKWPNVD